MELILFKVALHGANSKTTRLLHCICSTLTRELKEGNVWAYKFNYNYNPAWFCSWWTPYENYKAQELGGVFEFVIIPPNAKSVDFVLYKPCERRMRLVSLGNDYINENYTIPQIVSLNFKQPLQRYALFCEYEFSGLEFWLSFSTPREAAKAISKRYLEENDGRNNALCYLFVVVDLQQLVFEFSIPKHKNWRHFAQLEEARDQKWFWFVYLDGENKKQIKKKLAKLRR